MRKILASISFAWSCAPHNDRASVYPPKEDRLISKRLSSVLQLVVLACVIGSISVDFLTTPHVFVSDELTGRVCPAFYWAHPSGHLFYYTTPMPCSVSWTFMGVIGLCAVPLLLDRLWRYLSNESSPPD